MKTALKFRIICKEVLYVNRIRDLRKEKNMVQKELADKLGVKAQAISKYELGDLDLDTDTIRRLCKIFNCTADYLLGLSPLRTNDLSEDEAQLITAWRKADNRARQMVILALDPWSDEKEKEKTAG